jgi:hypothetical protein
MKKFNLKNIMILKGIFTGSVKLIDNASGSSLFKGGPACGGFALKKNSGRKLYYLLSRYYRNKFGNVREI